MTAQTSLAVSLGIALGLGLWTLLALVPRIGAAKLAMRVAPYVRDLSAEARDAVERRPSEPASVLAALAAPGAARVGHLFAAVLGGGDGIGRRLRQAGAPDDVTSFRSRQLLSTVAGAAAGVAVAGVLASAAAVSGLVLAGVIVLGAGAGLIAPEQLLARRARSRQARIAAELPTVLEFLTLSLSAGESILDALRRVARMGTGELAREFGRVSPTSTPAWACPRHSCDALRPSRCLPSPARSTSWSVPWNGERRSPTFCALKLRTRATTPSGTCSRPQAARRSRCSCRWCS